MALNVLGVDKLLDNEYGARLTRYVGDYQKTYELLLGNMRAEFNRNNFSGINSIVEEKLKNNPIRIKQVYTVPGRYDIGSLDIAIDNILLPVSKDIEAKKAVVSFPANIPCKCWSDAMFDLAKECEVEVRSLKYAGENPYEAFCKDVTEIDRLLSGIYDVTQAVHRLKTGLKADADAKLKLTKI